MKTETKKILIESTIPPSPMLNGHFKSHEALNEFGMHLVEMGAKITTPDQEKKLIKLSGHLMELNKSFGLLFGKDVQLQNIEHKCISLMKEVATLKAENAAYCKSFNDLNT